MPLDDRILVRYIFPMNGIVLLVSILSFAVGFSGFVLSIFMYQKYRSHNILFYTITLGTWSLNFYIIRILEIIMQKMVQSEEWVNHLVTILSHLSWGALSFLILYTTALLSGKQLKIQKLMFLFLASIFIMIPFEVIFDAWIPLYVNELTNYIQILLHIIILLSTAILLKKGISSISKKDTRVKYNRLSNIIFIMCPFFAIELSPALTRIFPYGVGIYSLFYLLLNVSFLEFLSHFIYFPKLNKNQEKVETSITDIYSFTKRQREIVQLLISGYSYISISEKLFIAPETVKTHVNNIYKKAQVSSKLELLEALKEK